jgi:hypothetical protein
MLGARSATLRVELAAKSKGKLCKHVIVGAFYPLLLTVASKFRLSLHPVWMSGIRGWIIVGAHHLVVRPAKELKPSLDWYGIVYLRVSPFNPILLMPIPRQEHQ